MKQILLLVIITSITSVYAQYSNSAISKGAENARKDSVLKMNEVIVTAKKHPLQTRVGEYNQPLWSTMRMFAATRVYVMNPPGSAMYEKWFDIRDRRDGPAQIRMRDEFTFGLGKRLQLDLYSHTVYDGKQGEQDFDWRGFSFEFRYALADWGKLPGNPTLYYEMKMLDGGWGIEPKLLLGGQLGSNSIWGVNAIYEGNLSPTREGQEREYAGTASYGYIVNNDLTVGASTMYRNNDGNSTEYYIGPLLQYRFNGRSYLTIEAMPGLTQESKASRTTIIFAYRF
jgi:hypothetical protein